MHRENFNFNVVLIQTSILNLISEVNVLTKVDPTLDRVQMVLVSVVHVSSFLDPPDLSIAFQEWKPPKLKSFLAMHNKTR